MCCYTNESIDSQMKQINQKYKNSNISILEHVLEIIKENKINFVLSVIKDEIIDGYDLSVEDYNIKGQYLTTRIDIEYMYSKLFGNNKNKNKIEHIIKIYGDKFKSIKYEKRFTATEHYKLVKQLEELKEQLNYYKQKYSE